MRVCHAVSYWVVLCILFTAAAVAASDVLQGKEWQVTPPRIVSVPENLFSISGPRGTNDSYYLLSEGCFLSDHDTAVVSVIRVLAVGEEIEALFTGRSAPGIEVPRRETNPEQLARIAVNVRNKDIKYLVAPESRAGFRFRLGYDNLAPLGGSGYAVPLECFISPKHSDNLKFPARSILWKWDLKSGGFNLLESNLSPSLLAAIDNTPFTVTAFDREEGFWPGWYAVRRSIGNDPFRLLRGASVRMRGGSRELQPFSFLAGFGDSQILMQRWVERTDGKTELTISAIDFDHNDKVLWECGGSDLAARVGEDGGVRLQAIEGAVRPVRQLPLLVSRDRGRVGIEFWQIDTQTGTPERRATIKSRYTDVSNIRSSANARFVVGRRLVDPEVMFIVDLERGNTLEIAPRFLRAPSLWAPIGVTNQGTVILTAGNGLYTCGYDMNGETVPMFLLPLKE